MKKTELRKMIREELLSEGEYYDEFYVAAKVDSALSKIDNKMSWKVFAKDIKFIIGDVYPKDAKSIAKYISK